MTTTIKQRLSRTHGKNGVPALTAIDDEPDTLDELYYPAELPAAQTVDGEMTGLHRVLVTAVFGATTRRS